MTSPAPIFQFRIFEHAMAILNPPKTHRLVVRGWRTTDSAAKPKPEHEAKFADDMKVRGFKPEDVKRLKLRPVTAAAAEALGFKPAQSGFVIPYFTLQGKPTNFLRIRYFDVKRDSFTGKEGRKYNQLPGSGNHLYLPPLVPWVTVANDPETPLCLTEGELKAATAALHKFPTIGLGGVWNFKNSTDSYLEAFNQFNWQDRTVYLCYDSDAALKWQVALAENHLAHTLLNLGAKPFIVRLPQLGDKKTGLDDFLLAMGGSKFDKVLARAELEKVIAAAQEYQKAQELFKLNEEVIYVRDPGLIYIPADHRKIKPRDFVQHAYANRIYEETVETEKGSKTYKRSAPLEWLRWLFRNEASKLTYEPGKEQNLNGAVNLWPGWACEPKRGTVKPWSELLDYLFEGAKPEDRKYAEQWLAYPIQNPGEKLFTAMVIWGYEQGTGKSTIGYTMERIYGENFKEIGDSDLGDAFNSWAENRQFVMGDEIATGEKKRDVANKMKSIITQQKLKINTKYVPHYWIPDCVNYYFTSNHPDAFFIDDADRRFFIHQVIGARLPDGFYERYYKWLDEEGGKEALFYYLLHLDMTGFNPKAAAPMTTAKAQNIEDGRTEAEAWVVKLHENPARTLSPHPPRKFLTSEEAAAIFNLGRDPKRQVTAATMGKLLGRWFKQANRHAPVRALGCRVWIIANKPDEIAELARMNEKQVLAAFRAERPSITVQKPATKHHTEARKPNTESWEA